MSIGFVCPHCDAVDTDRVVETRKGEGEVRRLRRRLKCNQTFTTYEVIRRERFYVVKKDETRQLFNRDKLRHGLSLAFTNVPCVDDAEIDEITDRIVDGIQSDSAKQILSAEIGRLVLDELLKNIKYHLAYLRFASVFLAVKDAEELSKLVYDIKAKLT